MTEPLVSEPYLLTTGYFPDQPASTWSAHAHREHELVWADRGSILIRIGERTWLLSPGIALWIPAGIEHEASTDDIASICSTHIRSSVGTPAWSEPTLVGITPAIREMLLYDRGTEMAIGRRVRTQSVCLDMLAPVADTGAFLPLPKDPRVSELVARVMSCPEDSGSLEAWAASLNLSARTLMRIFAAEVGMSFVQWRITVRMRSALGRLANGEPVGAVARGVGYSSVSTFTATFRRTLGVLPSDVVTPDEARYVA